MANPSLALAAEATLIAQRAAGYPITEADAVVQFISAVVNGHRNTVSVTVTIAAGDGAQTNLALMTVAAGKRVAITGYQVLASSVNSVAVDVRLGFGTATIPAAAATPVVGVMLDAKAIPAGGGVARGAGAGILAVGATDQELRLTCGAPTGGHVTVTASYFEMDA